MRKNILSKVLFVLLSVAVSATYISCKKKENTNTNPNGTAPSCTDGIQNQNETGVDCGGPCAPCQLSAREEAAADYKDNYLASNITNPGWTGSSSDCLPGSLPKSTHDKVIQRINYFRRMVGLNDNTTMDASMFAEYQQTAKLMDANGMISHTPDASWTCWSQLPLAGSGASTSNLASGSNSSGSIMQFIQDGGSNNTAVGHRRWILHSAKLHFSYGSTNSFMSLGCIGSWANGNSAHIPEYIAYPPNGFIPQSLVFPRWSFSIPYANFHSATVTMKDKNNSSVSVTLLPVQDGYGDNTLAWEPAGVDLFNANDISYTVTVSGITGAPKTTYTYTVTLFKP